MKFDAVCRNKIIVFEKKGMPGTVTSIEFNSCPARILFGKALYEFSKWNMAHFMAIKF